MNAVDRETEQSADEQPAAGVDTTPVDQLRDEYAPDRDDAADNGRPNRPPYTQNRELSWLDFNKRVLDQGADPNVPPLERLSFISIFWSNLKEFFMIRVGSLSDLLLLKKPVIDQKSGMTVNEQLDAIYARCHELYPYYEQTYNDLCNLLVPEDIIHLHTNDLDEKALAYLDTYMHANVMPILAPQIVNARHPFPHLENGRLYVIVRLNDIKTKEEKAAERASKAAEKAAREALAVDIEQTAQNAGDPNEPHAKKQSNPDKSEKTKTPEEGSTTPTSKTEKAAVADSKTSKNLGAEGVTLGIIPLPNQSKRIVKLPGKKFKFVLLEDLIEMYAATIFSMYKVKHTNVICVTRNADLDATEGSDEQGDDYLEHMKRILKKRTRLAPVRLECRRPLSSTVKASLLDRLNLKENQVFVTSVPLDLSFTYALTDSLPPEKRAALTQAPFTPAWPASLKRGKSIIKQVSKHEVLLSYPYESMEPFVQLLREAADDPDVISIEITLYRLASQSQLAEALIAAAEAGKEVTALLELRARFDESNNIEWSQRLEQAGCHVLYGFLEMKVHSKICVITCQTENGLRFITQLGTGNYNEKTARLYTDFSFITTDPSIGRDADHFFRNMALENTSDNYDVLWVAPLQIKQNILRGIDEEIEHARAGQPSGLFFKTNAITDMDIIEKIVQASQAGVHCTLFVRGISCLVPGIKGYTDNVRVVSIVGRLLEHSRIYCFGPRDNARVYLSSADLMTRNMDNRIEIAWPIKNPALRDEVLHYIDVCMSDTAKLRELLPDKSYTPIGYFARTTYESEDGTVKPMLFDAQEALIQEAHRRYTESTENTGARRTARPYTNADTQTAGEDANENTYEVADVGAAAQESAFSKDATAAQESTSPNDTNATQETEHPAENDDPSEEVDEILYASVVEVEAVPDVIIDMVPGQDDEVLARRIVEDSPNTTRVGFLRRLLQRLRGR